MRYTEPKYDCSCGCCNLFKRSDRPCPGLHPSYKKEHPKETLRSIWEGKLSEEGWTRPSRKDRK